MTNLHTLLLACAAAVLVAGPTSPPRPDPCPPEAGALVIIGWSAYRADSIEVAAERFARADQLCAGHLDAKVGLGFSRIRQERFAEAESLFTVVVAADSANGDGWDGLTLARWRLGNREGAGSAGRRAIALHPANATTRSILAAIRSARRHPSRPSASMPGFGATSSRCRPGRAGASSTSTA
jgi:tetratricopeptide (TPR) repeat protein